MMKRWKILVLTGTMILFSGCLKKEIDPLVIHNMPSNFYEYELGEKCVDGELYFAITDLKPIIINSDVQDDETAKYHVYMTLEVDSNLNDEHLNSDAVYAVLWLTREKTIILQFSGWNFKSKTLCLETVLDEKTDAEKLMNMQPTKQKEAYSKIEMFINIFNKPCVKNDVHYSGRVFEVYLRESKIV